MEKVLHSVRFRQKNSFNGLEASATIASVFRQLLNSYSVHQTVDDRIAVHINYSYFIIFLLFLN